MKIFISISLVFFLTNSIGYSAEQTDDLRQWKKLLHFGTERSRVVSREFFLSPVGNTDYLAELKASIRLLNSAHGQEIACNFPARYQWLAKTQDNIPHYDLKHCPGLAEFKQHFQKQTVSIVFASEYLDNPVSSFGHTLLVLHDKDKPLLSADTIHFAAKTDHRDGFVKYAWKGLTGGYAGYFFRDPFFKKQYQYNISEQRYLHLYTLAFTDKQIDTLLNHLYELRKATFKYYFINENCAYQIGNLLDIATDGVSFPDSGFVLPIEVIKQHRFNYTAHQVLYPTATIVQSLLAGMSKTEQDRFADIIEGKQLPNDKLSDRLKYALASYYEYNFRVNHIANANYDKVMQLHYTRPALDIATPEPLDKQGASRIAVGYLKTDSRQSMLLSYRPFLQDLLDLQPQDQQTFELSLFEPVLQIHHDTTSLYQFDLISMKSLPARSRYFKPVSWQFYTGLNRNNPAGELDYETEFGLGMTNKVAFLSLNYALNIGVDFSAGDYYYKPNATLLATFGDHFKLGLTASEKYYNGKKYIERNAFASLGYANYALQARYTTTSANQGEQLMLTLNRYFD